MTSPNDELAGRRVFLVEDESLISMLIEDALSDLGCQLADQASRLGEALQKAASSSFDLAILDVNLDGQPTFPVAEVLIRREISFIFATGYGSAGLPQSLRAIPVLHKPFEQRDLEKTLLAAWSAGPAQRLDRG